MDRRSTGNGKAKIFLADATRSVYRPALKEESFSQMLALEKERSRRSKQPFLLVLFDSTNNLSTGNCQALLGDLLVILGRMSRETDIIGWYKADHTVGVMFTELRAGEFRSTVTSILARLRGALKSCLSVDEMNRLHFTVQPFSGPDGSGVLRKRSMTIQDLGTGAVLESEIVSSQASVSAML